MQIDVQPYVQHERHFYLRGFEMSSCFKGSQARVEYQLQPCLDHAELSIQPTWCRFLRGTPRDRIETGKRSMEVKEH
ncbi:Hypothetical predicted protein [Paramuricea clavata]|uniref:Uncharacterized protein n=1 Tax=Paramuricea clavata TaxID=317549 RepID=A0A7D9HTN1_PARCT|nr:Hypothetical predicted protein [Paramuricea clavata]